MDTTYDLTAPKKATNVSINSDLLKQAKKLNINLSRTLEEHLSKLVREQQQQLWRQENSAAINDYNHRIAGNGVFSDGRRRF